MPTNKQKLVARDLVENPGKPVSRAMLDAGYSPNHAKNPQQLTESKGWQEILESHLPDLKLADVHAKALDAQKIHTSHTEPDRLVPDWQARLKALDLGYKLKGRLAPETQVNNQYNGDLSVSFSTDGSQATQDPV